MFPLKNLTHKRVNFASSVPADSINTHSHDWKVWHIIHFYCFFLIFIILLPNNDYKHVFTDQETIFKM